MFRPETERRSGSGAGLLLARYALAATVMCLAAGCSWVGGPSSGATPAPSAAPDLESVAGYRVLQPGALIAGFPADPLDMQSDLLVERGWDLAVGAAAGDGGDEIYVLDTFAKHVLRLDREGTLRAVIGGPGGGPGEFEDPYSIETDPRGGVWVADLQAGRLSRFDPDGHLLEELRIPPLTRGFGVLPNGAVLYRKFEGRRASLAIQSGDDVVDLAGELPPELAPDDVRSLWAEYDLEFAAVARDTVVVFRNTDVRAYGAWRIALDIPSARIADIAPLAFPAWLTEAIAAQAETVERESREAGPEGRRPGATRSVIPFSRGVRSLLDGLWVKPHPTGHFALTTTIPLMAGDSATVVARRTREWGSDCFEVDLAVVGERLVVLCLDQVRVYELLPGTPDLLPFTADPM